MNQQVQYLLFEGLFVLPYKGCGLMELGAVPSSSKHVSYLNLERALELSPMFSLVPMLASRVRKRKTNRLNSFF